jgi:predicted Fe-Mo cluster-binding NifX family protein
MKVALPKNGVMLNQHFGRSEEFSIVTVDEMDIIGLKEVNTEDLQHNHQGLSELLAKEGVSVVIVAGMGDGAYRALREKGIKVIRGASGSIKDVLHLYLNGYLRDNPSTHGRGHGNGGCSR